MRIIDDELVRSVLSMPECIDAMADAYAELARGTAASHPRQRYKVDTHANYGYIANMLAGALPSAGVAALRYDSMIVERENDAGGREVYGYRYPSRRSYGFVLLFSLETGEPLAAIQDFSLSAMRVAATTAAAVRVLARPESEVVALFGSGNEARTHVAALCAVLSLREIRVYSPSREHRETFAAEMQAEHGVDVRAVEGSADALDGADVVVAATNSSRPVFDGTLLVPGQTVCSIANSDRVKRRDEVDAATVLASSRVIVSHLATVYDNNQRELLDLIESNALPRDRVMELGAVLAGQSPGRERPDDIVYFKANTGTGLQFAAAGAIVLRACEAQNKGHVIPSDWFGADVGPWLDRGFVPSP
jgi:alanine dehydrogenase